MSLTINHTTSVEKETTTLAIIHRGSEPTFVFCSLMQKQIGFCPEKSFWNVLQCLKGNAQDAKPLLFSIASYRIQTLGSTTFQKRHVNGHCSLLTSAPICILRSYHKFLFFGNESFGSSESCLLSIFFC